MSPKLSAYLVIYNDWNFLEDALRSIAPYVDELVVVDGAYAWITPYLTALGDDPERSDPRVREIVAASGIPHRIIAGIWANQIEKRLAGYRACEGRYVCRIDADEICFFNEEKLERFFHRRSAVAYAEMPTYVAPGWVKSRSQQPPRGRRAKLRALFRGKPPLFNRHAFLFDRNQVDADIHVNYLSIIRDSDKRRRPDEKPFKPFPEPVAFNAHLTIWRPIPASLQRAESYVLHYILRHGVPWLPQLRDAPVSDLRTLFEYVPPQMFREIMAASRLGIKNMLGEQLYMAPTPLTADQEVLFAHHFDSLLDGHARLNRAMADEGLHFTPEMPIVIDLSNEDCIQAAAPDGSVHVEFESEVIAAVAHMHQIIPRYPWRIATEMTVKKTGNRLLVALPVPEAQTNPLRQEIELKVTTASPAPVQRFRILAERPRQA